jgi:precorrin-6B methylase 2
MVRQIEALGLAAINALEPTKGEQVLDIGRGCGRPRWLSLTG